MYGFETSSVWLQCRTSRQGHCQVHLGLESDGVSRFALGRINAQFSACSINRNIHEAVESDGYPIRCDAVGFKRDGQVAKAAVVGLLVAVDDTEGVLAAGREKKVMSAHSVLDYPQHHVATVWIQGIAFGEVDTTGVVESASGGNDLVEVMGVEGEQIRDLATLGVDDCQPLSSFQRERFAGANWYDDDLAKIWLFGFFAGEHDGIRDDGDVVGSFV